MENVLLPPSSKHSPLVGALVSAFQSLQPGDVITYTQIETLLRLRKSDQLFRYACSNAVKRSLKRHGIVMTNRRNQGYERATIEKVANGVIRQDIPGIRRKVNRSAEKINTVDPLDPALSQDGRRDALASRGLLGALSMNVSRQSVDSMKRHALETVQAPSMRELLPRK